MFERLKKYGGSKISKSVISFFALLILFTPYFSNAVHPEGVYPEPNHEALAEDFDRNFESYVNDAFNYWAEHGWNESELDQGRIDILNLQETIFVGPAGTIEETLNPSLNDILSFWSSNSEDRRGRVSGDGDEPNPDEVGERLGNAEAAKNRAESIGECKIGLVGTNIQACIYEGLAWFLNLLIEISGWILAWVAAIFRLAIKISILEFKTLISNEGSRLAWATLRDIANMFFIFILLYAAIGTILRISRVDAKKIVRNVILVALFINFSYVISSAIIDAGNQTAVFFYNGMTNNRSINIDERLVGALRLPEVVDLTGTKVNPGTGDASNEDLRKALESGGVNLFTVIIKGIGAVIVILIVAFLLGAAAFMFAARAVVLALLTITSPLAFLMMAFPSVGQAAGVSAQWWSKIVNQALFAPAYLLLTWAVLIITDKSSDSFFATGEGPLSTALYFFIISYMLYWSFSIAIKMGAVGASGAKSLYNKWRLKAASTIKTGATRAVQGAARQTAGRAAYTIANSGVARKLAAASPTIAGGALRLTDKVGAGFKDSREKDKKTRVERAMRIATDQATGEVDPDLLAKAAKNQQTLYERGKESFAENLPGVASRIGVKQGSTIGSQAVKDAGKRANQEKERQGYNMVEDGVDDDGNTKYRYETTKEYQDRQKTPEEKERQDRVKQRNTRRLKEAKDRKEAIEKALDNENSDGTIRVPTGEKRRESRMNAAGIIEEHEVDVMEDVSRDKAEEKLESMDKRINRLQKQLGRQQEEADNK